MEHTDIAPRNMRGCANVVLDLFPDIFERGHEVTDLRPAPTVEERPGGTQDGRVKMHHRLAWSKLCQRIAHNLDAAGKVAKVAEGRRHQLQCISAFSQR